MSSATVWNGCMTSLELSADGPQTAGLEVQLHWRLCCSSWCASDCREAFECQPSAVFFGGRLECDATANYLSSKIISKHVNIFQTTPKVARDLVQLYVILRFQNSTVRTHYPRAHQPSLASRPRTYLLQTGSYDVSIHPRHLSILPAVMFHPRFRHDIQTTAAVFYLTSSGRSAGSSLYSRQAGVSGFGCHRLERPASPLISAPSLAVFRQQLKTFLFSRSYQDTIIWLVCCYHHSSLQCGQWTPEVPAIINITLCLWWWWRWWWWWWWWWRWW